MLATEKSFCPRNDYFHQIFDHTKVHKSFQNKFAINLLIRLEIQMKHELKQRKQNQLKFSTTGLISKFLHMPNIIFYHKEALNFKFHMAENFHLQHWC